MIDLAWIDKPKEKIKKFFLLDKKFHGLSFQQKLSKIKPKNNDLLLVTSPESICWLLNIRGYDLNYTPIVFCRLIITKEKIEFFVNKNKIPDDFETVYKNVITYDIKVFEKKIRKFKKRNY